jgi:ribA/ribD-fused uncharacterized protein
MTDFLFFWGHNRKRLGDKAVFSQFYNAPFYADGERFKTAEHWMMYQKALLFEDYKIADKIMETDYPGKAKELGRKVADFSEEVWDREKVAVVRLGTIFKFSQTAELEDILIGTENKILVEASPSDPVWGIGLTEDDFGATRPAQWQGDNLLGFILMDARAYLSGKTMTSRKDIT